MNHYIWLFPILFIFHDLEEIIGFETWFKKNKELVNKFPKISRIYNNYSTAGMALAVFEEFFLCLVICILSIVTKWYALWLGFFIVFALHLVMHMIQSVVIRKYIPAVATSIIALPISIWLISDSLKILNYLVNVVVIYSIISVVIVVLNLKFAHMLMHRFTKWING